MKTQKKADATYKSTKNIQRARSGDNLSSTTGTDERAAPRTTVVTQVPPGAKPHVKYLQVAPVLGAEAAAAAGEGRVFHKSSHQT